MREHWREDEIKELLASEGGVEAGMDSLENYRACLEHFAGIAARSRIAAHEAQWASTHAAWRNTGCASTSPVRPPDPQCVWRVSDTTELVILRYEAPC